MAVEIIDESGKNVTELIQLMVQHQVDTLSLQFFRSILIKVSNNFNADYYHYETHPDYYNTPATILEQHLAMAILPTDETCSRFVILLRPSIFDGEEFINTITHELTHLNDYAAYFNDAGNVYIQPEINKPTFFYYEFYFWTEFNAKRSGIKNYKAALEQRGAGISLAHTTQNFMHEVANATEKMRKLYLLMHFLGRLSVYDAEASIYSDDSIFPKVFIGSHFGIHALTIYLKFKDLFTYEDFKNQREEIKKIVENLWRDMA